MGTKGLILRSVTITAKEKICFQDEVRCSSQHCPYADGYYDRINGAILDLFNHERQLTRTVLEKYAQKHRVCPFEMSLDAAYAADAVIGDYNYVFDPRISLKRLWEEDKRKTAILVDEAHNLVDRAREMFSAELTKAPFLELQRGYKLKNRALSEGAKGVNAVFISLRRSLGEKKSGVRSEPPEELLLRLEEFAALAERELAMGGVSTSSGDSQEPQQQLLDAYYAAQAYIRIAGYYDERYVTYMEQERSDVRIKLFCRDPSVLLRQMGKGYRSHIFFSATLSPLGYYRDMLGADEEDYSVSVPSPFSKEQLEVELLPLSTRYRDREGSRGPIVSLLQRILRGRSGNVLLFFPSYEYMNDVAERFREEEPGANLLVQEMGMGEAERERFLGAFQAGCSPSVVGFAVLGGIFSEGVDLTGDRLTNVVVVGVGLPQVGGERNLIKEYFDGTGRNGFDYAYVYPGMNKVLQAGGRLIRTERDRGLLVLVDDRFLSPGYQQLLPEEWKPLKVLRSREQEAKARWFGLYE
jgi:DNA excision repair protein ERCC-2